MKNGVDVSVVMGVYDSGDTLPVAVESILSQDDVAYEFIIVNDGSTGKTVEMLEGYAEKDPRVRIIHQEHQGLTSALIKGCAEAKGDYIARQDSGDVSLPGRLSMQKRALDNCADLAFVSCWTEFCGPRGEFLFLTKGTGRAVEPAHILSLSEKKGTIDGPSHHGSVMFRRDIYMDVGGYREEFYFGQDWDLWYRLAEKGKFQMIGQTLYRAAVSPGSISGNHRKAQVRIAELSRAALVKRLDGQSDKHIIKKAAAIRAVDDKRSREKAEAAWLYFIGECLRKNSDDRAFFYLKKSIFTNPFFIKAWVRSIQYVSSRVRKRLIGRT